MKERKEKKEGKEKDEKGWGGKKRGEKESGGEGNTLLYAE